MIRYSHSATKVRAEVKRQKDSWLGRAEERTERFIALGEYDEDSSIWSEIKPAFMKLQHNKCAFCEQKLEGGRYGRINHDLEHFRPKNSLNAWPPRGSRFRRDIPTGSTNHTGYYWLAYDLSNYATACKVCNSSLKSNRFPIAANRGSAPQRAKALRIFEDPYLCYPIGDTDKDPEKLIGFEGTVAFPVGRTRKDRLRAEVMIEFFKLNARDDLHEDRAAQIVLLHSLALSKPDPALRKKNLEILLGDEFPHASCSRDFARLWASDRGRAMKILELAENIMLKITNPATDAQ